MKRNYHINNRGSKESQQDATLREIVARECKTLYGGAECAYWECNEGWDEVLARLSYKLEALNVMYRRWKVRVVADQVKEKYATLRFYFHCSLDTEKPTRGQIVMQRYVEELAEEYVRQAEKECYYCCELCGQQIGVDGSPRCYTLGWYRYICKACAEKGNGGDPFRYEMDGKLYEGGKRIANPFKKRAKSAGRRVYGDQAKKHI